MCSGYRPDPLSNDRLAINRNAVQTRQGVRLSSMQTIANYGGFMPFPKPTTIWLNLLVLRPRGTYNLISYYLQSSHNPVLYLEMDESEARLIYCDISSEGKWTAISTINMKSNEAFYKFGWNLVWFRLGDSDVKTISFPNYSSNAVMSPSYTMNPSVFVSNSSIAFGFIDSRTFWGTYALLHSLYIKPG